MTGPSSQEVAKAQAELEHALHDLHKAAARAQEKTRLTREQQDELTRKALSGRLGPEMRRLAERVSGGHDTWTAIFAGASAESELLNGYVAAAAQTYGPAIAAALEGLDPESDDEPGRAGGTAH